MTTAGVLIARAFRESGVFGVGQTAQAQDTTDALASLNSMIGQWNRRRWLVYHLVDTGFACTGAQSYTVGAGQQFAIARPDRIEAAYIRQTVPTNPTPIDWALRMIPSMEMYSALAIKTLAASPSEYLFYDSGYPIGRLYPWPVPNNQYELHIITKAVLSTFPTTATEIVLPPEYEDALMYSLQMRLRSAYRLAPDPVIAGLAKAALNTIRRANTQISNLGMPRAIRRGPAYNIYSDSGG